MRFDKPIGSYLLLAPIMGLHCVSRFAKVELLITFVVAVVMRAAGCTTNDLTDRKLDGYVERTKHRPLVTGAISPLKRLHF